MPIAVPTAVGFPLVQHHCHPPSASSTIEGCLVINAATLLKSSLISSKPKASLKDFRRQFHFSSQSETTKPVSSMGSIIILPPPIDETAGFRLFPKLPAELRLKIWKCALPGTRILRLALSKPGGSRNSDCFLEAHLQNPILLRVNHESRSLVQKNYTILSGIISSPYPTMPLYFSPQNDVLFLSAELPLQSSLATLKSGIPAIIREKIQNVAIVMNDFDVIMPALSLFKNRHTVSMVFTEIGRRDQFKGMNDRLYFEDVFNKQGGVICGNAISQGVEIEEIVHFLAKYKEKGRRFPEWRKPSVKFVTLECKGVSL